ncbi:MAG: helix-turn-helix domain-containing protein [Candidatus Baltobacteraceae bacterium]
MIDLDILCATASQDGRLLDLPPRELALICALALGPRVWPSYQLIPLLWPDAHASRSSSLKVYVHRLRRRLGAGIIASTNKGYELSPTARIDIWEAEALARKERLSDMERLSLSRFYLNSLKADRSFLNRCEWFDGTEELIKSSLCWIATRLAQDAIDRGERDEAMTILRSAGVTTAVKKGKVVPLRRYLAHRQATALSS